MKEAVHRMKSEDCVLYIADPADNSQEILSAFREQGFRAFALRKDSLPQHREEEKAFTLILQREGPMTHYPAWIGSTEQILIHPSPLTLAGGQQMLPVHPDTLKQDPAALVELILNRTAEPERYSLDLSSLDSHGFFRLMKALLQRFTFDSLHTLPMDNIFSFMALKSMAVSLGGAYQEAILICLDEDSRQRLKDKLDSTQSPQDARTMIFQELGRHAPIPAKASLLLLLPIREMGSEQADELGESFGQGFPGRVVVWDREDIKEQLYRKGASLIPRFFAPASQLLEQALKEKTQEAEEKQARINELKRINQRLDWEERSRARAERDAVWKSLSLRISHKLGNPIATIGLIEGNMRHPLTEEQKTGLLDDLRDTLQKCNRLLQEMKNYAATGVKLARTESRELLPILARPFEKKSYKVEYAVHPCVLHADTDKLGQVLDELIANGEYHAAAQGKTPVMTLHFSLTEGRACPVLDEKKNYLLLAVADNGPGVLEGKKSKIFNLYFTTRQEGSGQGLAIAEKIIRDHDGAIVEEGREGALFKIYLPIIEEEEDSNENTAG